MGYEMEIMGDWCEKYFFLMFELDVVDEII